MDDIKTYSRLPIPKDSAWERNTFWRKLPSWLKEFLTGCNNLIKWAPTIWKQRDWDDAFIFDVLQKIYTFDQITLNHFSVLLSSVRKMHNIDDHLSALFSEYTPKYYYYNRDNLVKVKTLMFIRPPVRPLHFIPETFDFLRKKYLN